MKTYSFPLLLVIILVMTSACGQAATSEPPATPPPPSLPANAVPPTDTATPTVDAAVAQVAQETVDTELMAETETAAQTQVALNKPATATFWPTWGWRESTPEEQGFDSDKLVEGLQAILERDIKPDSLLIIRNGTVILDAYFYPFDGTTTHDLASVTKSVMTTLIGIAAGQGKLELDQPMVSFFPKRTISDRDERKEQITVRHLAASVGGFIGCPPDDTEKIAAIQAEPDWVQAALDREMVQAPGSRFCYDSPGMHLLSAILQKATGMTALEFAQQYLFTPLGIQEVIWESDPQGYTRGWSGLHLKPHDAAKIGYLFLHNGVWEGKQIVPQEWVVEATNSQTPTRGDEDYGYGWWVSDDRFFALGRGGQFILIFPALDEIIVITDRNFVYNDIEPYLVAALVDPENPLAPNPDGVVRLKEMVTALAQAPTPQPLEFVPEIAQAVSGKTYVFGPNPENVETMRFDLNDTAQAVVYITHTNSNEITTWPIGLDGVYRHTPDGWALLGIWDDPQTLVIEFVDISTWTYRVHFEGDKVTIESPELELQFEGKMETPE